MAIQSVNQLAKNVNLSDPVSRSIFEQQISKYVAGQPVNTAAVAKARDTYAAGSATAKVDLKGQAPVGQQPSTASPHANYSHQAQQTAGTYYVPLSSDQVALTTKSGSKIVSGSHLGRIMNEKDPKYVSTGNPQGFRFAATRQGLIERNGLTQSPDGTWLAPVQQPAAGNIGDLIPGLGSSTGAMGSQAAIGQSGLNVLGRNTGFLAGAGALSTVGGPIGMLVGGSMFASALKKSGGSFGGLTGAGASMGSGAGDVLGGFGKLSGLATYGTGANALASAFGISTEGLQNNMRMLVASKAREFKLDSMMGMIDNPGIPIEDLIFMFMAAMGDQYEEKLREKMKETAIAEKMAERRDRRTKKADMAAGLAQGVGGMFGPIGGAIGMVVGQGAKSGAMKLNQLESGLNGNQKSSTMLMQEVQMLMQKWKQLNEMLSNLLKALHDMAMTPIRNLR